MRGIHAASYSSEEASTIAFSDYDLIILTSSWDNRCITLTDSHIESVSSVILLLFDDKDEAGVRSKNDTILKDYSKSISNNQYVIRGNSTSVNSVWNELYDTVLSVACSIGRPLSILCDLSCCPRYYSLSLLSTCFRFGIASRIHYFYNECTYPEKDDELSLEEVSFTAGRWEAKAINYLAGSHNPGSRNRFTVSIGFEGSKTLMVLNEFEPDKVNVIIPSPGYSEGYVDRVRSANSELFRSFGVNSENEILSHAGDPIDVWAKISKARDARWNDHYLCAGSKPHSLGLTLAAYSLQYPVLLYSLPKKHNPIDVIPKPDCWLYEVHNIVVPQGSND